MMCIKFEHIHIFECRHINNEICQLLIGIMSANIQIVNFVQLLFLNSVTCFSDSSSFFMKNFSYSFFFFAFSFQTEINIHHIHPNQTHHSHIQDLPLDLFRHLRNPIKQIDLHLAIFINCTYQLIKLLVIFRVQRAKRVKNNQKPSSIF